MGSANGNGQILPGEGTVASSDFSSGYLINGTYIRIPRLLQGSTGGWTKGTYTSSTHTSNFNEYKLLVRTCFQGNSSGNNVVNYYYVQNSYVVAADSPEDAQIVGSSEALSLLPPMQCTPTPQITVGWSYLGNQNFTTQPWGRQYQSLYVYNGTPFVAFSDGANSGEVTLMMYNGNSWENVGPADFTPGYVRSISLFVDNDPAPFGTPYVAFSDGSTGQAMVMMYNSSTKAWTTVGDADFSTGVADSISLFVYGGIPYVAYNDESTGYVVVKVYNASTGNWMDEGPTDFSPGGASYVSLFIYNGMPFVAFNDTTNNWRASVMMFNGTVWKNEGLPDFSQNTANYISLYVYNGTPYVAFQDGANGDRASVMNYVNNNWGYVGSPGFTTNSADETCLSFSGGNPYIGYADHIIDGEASVMTFNGTAWTPVGSYDFSSTIALNLTFVYPYIAFKNNGKAGYTNVMVYGDYVPTVTPTLTPSQTPTPNMTATDEVQAQETETAIAITQTQTVINGQQTETQTILQPQETATEQIIQAHETATAFEAPTAAAATETVIMALTQSEISYLDSQTATPTLTPNLTPSMTPTLTPTLTIQPTIVPNATIIIFDDHQTIIYANGGSDIYGQSDINIQVVNSQGTPAINQVVNLQALSVGTPVNTPTNGKAARITDLSGNVITKVITSSVAGSEGMASFKFNAYNASDLSLASKFAAATQINMTVGTTVSNLGDNVIISYDTFPFYGNVSGQTNFISDAAFTNSSCNNCTINQINNFFNSEDPPSALATVIPNSGTPVANMIINACQTPNNYGIALNPGVIITTMEKEKTIITCDSCNDPNYVAANKIDNFACGITSVDKDFAMQLATAVAAFENCYPTAQNTPQENTDKNDNPDCCNYSPTPMNYMFYLNGDNSAVIITSDQIFEPLNGWIEVGNEAAYSLFRYTPHVNEYSTDNAGVHDFWYYWDYYDSGGGNGTWGTYFGGP